MTAEATQTVPEGLELHDNGTITAVLDGERFQLRRPRVGEFRKLREVLHESQDHLHELADEVKAAGQSLASAQTADNDAESLRLLSEVRRLNRRYDIANEDANMGWMHEAFAMLADKPIGANDDLPLWMADGSTITTLIEHWRTVPLARGVR